MKKFARKLRDLERDREGRGERRERELEQSGGNEKGCRIS